MGHNPHNAHIRHHLIPPGKRCPFVHLRDRRKQKVTLTEDDGYVQSAPSPTLHPSPPCSTAYLLWPPGTSTDCLTKGLHTGPGQRRTVGNQSEERRAGGRLHHPFPYPSGAANGGPPLCPVVSVPLWELAGHTFSVSRSQETLLLLRPLGLKLPTQGRRTIFCGVSSLKKCSCYYTFSNAPNLNGPTISRIVC